MWIGVDWNIRMKWGSRAAEAIPFLRPAIPLSWARTGLGEAKKEFTFGPCRSNEKPCS